jgi:hypothetical protein
MNSLILIITLKNKFMKFNEKYKMIKINSKNVTYSNTKLNIKQFNTLQMHSRCDKI